MSGKNASPHNHVLMLSLDGSSFRSLRGLMLIVSDMYAHRSQGAVCTMFKYESISCSQ